MDGSSAVAEENNIAFLNNVFFSFQADLGFFFGGVDAPGGEKIFAANDFSANKTLFDVAVNFPGGFDGGVTPADGPGAHFGFARGEERNQTHQVIGGANQAIQAGFFQAVGGEEFGRCLFFHFREFGFQASADRDDRRVGTALQRGELVLLDGLVEFGGFVVTEIQHVEHRPLRKKEKTADGLALLGCKFEFPQRFFGFEMHLALFENTLLMLEQRVLLFLQVLFDPFQALGNLIVVRKNQLKIEIGGIAKRIDAALGMRHAGIVEDANDVGDGIHIAQRSEAFAHALFLHAGEIHVLHRGVGDLLWVVELGKFAETRLGNLGNADVRRLAALRVHVGFGEDSKQRGLSDLW